MTKFFKRSIIFAVCIASLFAGVFIYNSYISPMRTERIDATYVSYSSLEKLSKYADMILIAKPLKSFEDCTPTITYNPNGRIEDEYTVSSFEVKKVIKGDSSIKNVDISQPTAIVGGDLGKKVLQITGDYYTIMKKDQKYLLFLKKVENENFYSLVSLEYGKYNLDEQDKDESNITNKSSDFKKIKSEAMTKYKEMFN